MGKLIQFPTGKILSSEEHMEDMSRSLSDDAIAVSRHLLDVLEDELLAMDIDWLYQFDIRNDNTRESRDAFVLVNCIYGMLSRYMGVEHLMQKELDTLFVKIKQQEAENRNTYVYTPEDGGDEIEFTFDPDGKDDDTT